MSLRKELKHDFLKQIIFRVDFKGLLDRDVDKCISEIRESLFNNGFVNDDARVESREDQKTKIELNLQEEDAYGNINLDTIYSFQSEDQNESLEISKTFLKLAVAIQQNYDGFDKYVNLLAEVIVKLKSKSPFFKVIRTGLRKVNLCYIYDLKNLANYFKKGAFNISETMECMNGVSCKASEMHTVFEKEQFLINYVRNLQEGRMMINRNPLVVYQVVLDIEAYCNDVKKCELLFKDKEVIQKTITSQNELVFDCYVNSLSEDFKMNLTEVNFQDNNIVGVH